MLTSKYFIFLFVLISIFTSCGKCPEECASGEIRILGGCTPGFEGANVFGGFPKFHCFDDSLVLVIKKPKIETLFGTQSYHLNNPKKKSIYGVGPYVESSWYFINCFTDATESKEFITFLYIKDYESINNQTKEIPCILYNLSERVWPINDKIIIPKDIILDSLEYTMQRIN